MKNKYVIVDIKNMDFMKDEQCQIVFYDTEEEALNICGMYEFEDAWVVKLIYNYIENITNNKLYLNKLLLSFSDNKLLSEYFRNSHIENIKNDLYEIIELYADTIRNTKDKAKFLNFALKGNEK